MQELWQLLPNFATAQKVPDAYRRAIQRDRQVTCDGNRLATLSFLFALSYCHVVEGTSFRQKCFR
eukprot:2378780-Amphidinium_carterae.1